MADGPPSGREAREVFFNAVKFVLGNWPAVRVAVEQGFVGQYSSEKERWLEQVVFSLFLENEVIDSLDVEDYLAEILSNEFNVLIEDESLPKVSQTLCNFYQSCKNGDHSRVSAEIMSVQLPKLNVKCDNTSEDDVMDFSEHCIVAQQLKDLNLREEPCSSSDTSHEQPASDLNGRTEGMNHGEEPNDDGGEWVVVHRSKQKR